ncbi:hypothetical protein LBMAG29_00090 [Methylophilaceae bacterium]|jgi:hypothetical protein|nr:hypothetical protein [Candidatus Methylopumilus sp.]GDX54699.1 hypothetical protein LBMAG29_00090 [Methylophilaceae bacterium]
MKRYMVYAFETVSYAEEIEAYSEDEAIDLFKDLILQRTIIPDSSEGLEIESVDILED